MSLIGLEISDAGILAAAGNPVALLALEGQSTESPGFALPQKKGLLVGKEAETGAHLFPRQILNRFWDQLNTESLPLSGRYAPRSNAEIVYSHLARIWQTIQPHGKEAVLVVPDFYDRHQLGIILGISRELSMDIEGFVPLALAASTVVRPNRMLLYLDIHLHRLELVYLKQGEYLTIEDSGAVGEKGLIQIYRQWVEAIAGQFVHHTRFDPLHQAASEQGLYDRLPALLSHVKDNAAVVFDIVDNGVSYSTTLERELFIHTAEPVYREIDRLVEDMRQKHDRSAALTLQVSHRLTRLPGCLEMLARVPDAEIIELGPGAAARGVLEIWPQLAAQRSGEGASLFTSRPWLNADPGHGLISRPATIEENSPTHLLYRSIAHPITEKPLAIGATSDDPETSGLQFHNGPTEGSFRFFTIERRGQQVVLTDYSTQGIYVDGTRIKESTGLKLGQTIRLGKDGETFRLIACLKNYET